MNRLPEPMGPRHIVYALLCGLAGALIVVGILVFAALLTGCSKPPSTGTVTAKNFTRSYTWYEQVCVSYNSNGICRLYMPFPHTEPDEYQLCLRRDAQDTAHDAEGCWDTDPATYARYQIGDHYPDARRAR